MKRSGVIILDKPEGKTSHDMVYFIRRLLGIKKVGHTGTLDPDATGVLPICIGSATKASDMLIESDKGYVAKFVLGKTTDTEDISGKVLTECAVNLTKNEIEQAIYSFIGSYDQIPPMYSAIKKDGKKLYELARKGISVEREKRHITIHDIKILSIGDEIEIEVLASKGTYIRTLCADIGKALNVGACMTKLRRIKTGPFNIADSYTQDELIRMYENGEIDNAIIEVDKLFTSYPKIKLTQNQTRSVKNGVIMTYHKSDGLYRVYDDSNEFICIGAVTDEKIKVEKSFWT